MIGVPFLQLSRQYGLTYDQGVAYGTINGFPVTFLDGAGCHRIMVTTRFTTPSQKDTLMDIINAQDLKGLYHIRKLQIAKKVIHIVFRGVPDTMDKVPAFINWFFPLLEQNGASRADVCIQCQEPIVEEDGQWVLRDGAVAFRMHKHCAEELKQSVSGKKTADPEGSLGKGIAGAAIGAVLGAVLWAVLQYIGFFAPIVGMAIGWLAVTMYGKLDGKTGKLRLPVLTVATVLGVVLGVVSAEIPALLQTGAGWQVLSVFLENLRTNYAYQSGIYGNLVMGLMFSALGLFVSLKSNSRKTSDMTVTDLK